MYNNDSNNKTLRIRSSVDTENGDLETICALSIQKSWSAPDRFGVVGENGAFWKRSRKRFQMAPF